MSIADRTSPAREKSKLQTNPVSPSPYIPRATQPDGQSHGRRRRTPRWLIAAGLAGAAVIAGIFLFWNPFRASDAHLVFYTVKRGDLPIVVTERGTIESQENVQVFCEIDDIDGDGIRGTPILWIAHNGASVKKGDLIVEFESSGHLEQRDRQILDVEKAQSEYIQAKAKYDNQLTQNITTLANAKLEKELADLELEMFNDTESGTHKLEVDEINRKIDDLNSQILIAKADLELAKKEQRASETLFKLGYAGKSDLDETRLQLLRAESQHAAKLNELETQLAALQKKTSYERQMQTKTLQGKLDTADRNVDQVKVDNDALKKQAKAALDAAQRTLKKEEERLKRYETEYKNTKIYSPADGMIAYAVSDSSRWWLEEIRPGAPVRKKQHMLSIPNLRKMQVRTAVHESVIDQIEAGLPATVHLEAFPDKHYSARVKSIAVLADQQSPETKVYETIVTIDGEVEQLKPGMTAVVNIHVKRITNTLTVPVQAVVQVNKESWVYVDAGLGVERRNVKLGPTNHKFVEIRKGLQEGDRVVLNPMVIIDEKDEQSPSASDSDAMPALDQAPPPPNSEKNKKPAKQGKSRQKKSA